MLIPFVQFEFSHALGPRRGRYVVAAPDLPSGDPQRPTDPVTGVNRRVAEGDVLVVSVVEAPAALRGGLVRRSRARSIRPGQDPAVVPLQRLTLLGAGQPLEDARARAWLKSCARDAEEAGAWIAAGLAVVNRAIAAHRIAAGDPLAVEVTLSDARAVRVGIATPEEAADGDWTEAMLLAPPSAPTFAAGADEDLRLGRAVADALGGRMRPSEAHELALRALMDLEYGRGRAAAFGLHAAVVLGQAELGGAPPRASGASESEELAERAARAAPGPSDLERIRELLVDLVGVLHDAAGSPARPTDRPALRSARHGSDPARSP